MLLTFTDANTGNSVAINPTQVVCVFTGKNDDGKEQTVINLLNGNIVVGEDYLTVVGQLQEQLK